VSDDYASERSTGQHSIMTYSVDEFLGGRVTLFGGDNREILIDAPDNSIEAILTDGPYALVSIVKRFGGANAAPAKGNEAYARASKGFMGKTWDTGEVVNDPGFWGECLRVLKPGGHLLSFGGTRTYHRMACAVEDAGFEIRDMIQWLYGSGFPKSHDVLKGIDAKIKLGSARTEDIRKLAMGENYEPSGRGRVDYDNGGGSKMNGITGRPEAPCAEALEWQGWGTALKPANEPIVLARKPLSEKTVAANVLKWGTGAINIDGCRVGDELRHNASASSNEIYGQFKGAENSGRAAVGRFPANVITDGSDEVVSAFPDRKGGQFGRKGVDGACFGHYGAVAQQPGYGDEGSAARFFYQAKANKTDRANSKHPTVKPVALMRYLARLITPPGGTILDPFAGSGTTGEAAYLEGFNCYLMEREKEYIADIGARFNAMPVAEQPANDNAQFDLEDAIAMVAARVS